MTGRVLRFAKSAHQSTAELLPWFLTGTLEADEAAQVEEHLRSCPGCRSELELLRELKSDYVATEPAYEAAQDAFAKLRPRLDEVAPARRPSSRASARSTLRPTPIPARVRMALTSEFPIPGWVKLALAAQFALIFGLGWAVLQPDRSALTYHTLASATSEHAAGSLVVVFNPSTPQRDVARILRASGGHIVDGPTVSNGYVLAVPDQGLATALNRLRAETAVVLAEPLKVQ